MTEYFEENQINIKSGNYYGCNQKEGRKEENG